MKIIHHVQVEEGDTLASIAEGVSKYTGVDHTTTDVWDFNRQHMPTPKSLPPVGTILRFPHDPHGGKVDGSGGPKVEDLAGKGVDADTLAKATTEATGTQVSSTDGKSADQVTGDASQGDRAAAADGANAGAGLTDGDGFTAP